MTSWVTSPFSTRKEKISPVIRGQIASTFLTTISSILEPFADGWYESGIALNRCPGWEHLHTLGSRIETPTTQTSHSTHTTHTDTTQTRTSFLLSVVFMMIHNELLISFGDESGQTAVETAASSKEGSRRDLLTHQHNSTPTSWSLNLSSCCCVEGSSCCCVEDDATSQKRLLECVKRPSLQVEQFNLHAALLLLFPSFFRENRHVESFFLHATVVETLVGTVSTFVFGSQHAQHGSQHLFWGECWTPLCTCRDPFFTCWDPIWRCWDPGKMLRPKRKFRHPFWACWDPFNTCREPFSRCWDPFCRFRDPILRVLWPILWVVYLWWWKRGVVLGALLLDSQKRNSWIG